MKPEPVYSKRYSKLSGTQLFWARNRKRVQKYVFARDKGICAHCGRNTLLDRGECIPCHALKTTEEGARKASPRPVRIIPMSERPDPQFSMRYGRLLVRTIIAGVVLLLLSFVGAAIAGCVWAWRHAL